MARNIEIKAAIPSVEMLLPKVVAVADHGPVEIDQDDTFFVCSNGRLKLRVFPDQTGELIFYRRADQVGPKESFYLRSPIATPAILGESLWLAYGQAGRVRKHRIVFQCGRSRIHLDRVEGLGDFLEIEVVLADDENAGIGVREASDLLARLGVREEDLIPDAYVDLSTRGGNRSAANAESGGRGDDG